MYSTKCICQLFEPFIHYLLMICNHFLPYEFVRYLLIQYSFIFEINLKICCDMRVLVRSWYVY